MVARADTPTIAIIGSGFAGIAMAIQLQRANIHSFVIYERAQRVGGTWRDNVYPGAACDIPSLLYSFSFEPVFDWSQVYASQEEILRYLELCVERHGLRSHIRFGANITSGAFDEELRHWRLRLDDGEEVRAQIVISGVGQLGTPKLPDIPGLHEFGGSAFHSARWNSSEKLAGKRVAIIGNGASSAQLLPRVAEVASQVTLFQRTPSWVIPHFPRSRAYRAWERWAFRYVPGFAALYRFLYFVAFDSRVFAIFKGSWLNKFLEWLALRNIRSAIADPALRERLTPEYPVACKRILLSTEYYPAFARDNVALETNAIERIASDGIITRAGAHHPFDVIVLATGFDTHRYLSPVDFRGLGGRLLSSAWGEGSEAYLGMTMAGFPNLFMLYGPNTNLGHNSIVFMIECQVSYILRCVELLQKSTLPFIDTEPGVQANYNRALQLRLAATYWTDCVNWYRTESGKITSNWGGSATAYWLATRRFDARPFAAGRAERTSPQVLAEPGSQSRFDAN